MFQIHGHLDGVLNFKDAILGEKAHITLVRIAAPSGTLFPTRRSPKKESIPFLSASIVGG